MKLRTKLLVPRTTAHHMKNQRGPGGPAELEPMQPQYPREKDGQIYTRREGYLTRRFIGRGGRERTLALSPDRCFFESIYFRSFPLVSERLFCILQ